MLRFITEWADKDPDARYGLLLVAVFVAWGVAGFIANPMELHP